jgi:hypothetical protein
VSGQVLMRPASVSEHFVCVSLCLCLTLFVIQHKSESIYLPTISLMPYPGTLSLSLSLSHTHTQTHTQTHKTHAHTLAHSLPLPLPHCLTWSLSLFLPRSLSRSLSYSRPSLFLSHGRPHSLDPFFFALIVAQQQRSAFKLCPSLPMVVPKP